ncbi:uncharacterized protein LOC133533307 [Cydia pomonella]|uniref:uncharacterized protein LOC133533307 n=1 Tax=Cydia pomonella TaxID=82600 RepID=UPI002ADE8370|nr:uncharacterized protein LOC133533307 [Cydia pomonella]
MFHAFAVTLYLSASLTIVAGEPPHFRILAPEFVCPKEADTGPKSIDNTIITLRTPADAKLDMRWTVRWTPLPAPSQRFTLMLWRATRQLEKKLNGPQKEPYVYIIENDELLRGVDYKFNVTASNSEGEETTKTFHINNAKGEQLLQNLEGRTDMLSIILVGGEETYADVELMMDALVTTCHPTQDFYFEWSAESAGHKIAASPGGRLELPTYSLRAGLTYLVTCRVVSSAGELITQNSLPLMVLQRSFEVYLCIDYLEISVNTAFTLESIVLNHDYFGESFSYQWTCSYEEGDCNSFFQSIDSGTLNLESGLPTAGKYQITLTVNIHNHSASASAIIIGVQHASPVIQINPLPRTLNEGTRTSLVANASNVTPTCSLTWYFASEEYLESQKHVLNDTCEDCQHGVPLTETLTIFSFEENFLYYLTDFSNETEWRQITAEMPAAAGRARFVVECGCTQILECVSEGTVYADMFFNINGIPRANMVMVTPDTGTALETLFRISTLAVVDGDTPLYYTFRCRVGVNSSLVLGAYADHLAVETFLPYMEHGVEVWVEVCDVLGACSRSVSKVVHLLTGDGASVDELLQDVHAHIRRCELLQLQRVSVAAIVTYEVSLVLIHCALTILYC